MGNKRHPPLSPHLHFLNLGLDVDLFNSLCYTGLYVFKQVIHINNQNAQLVWPGVDPNYCSCIHGYVYDHVSCDLTM